jgi:hypothetical protein
MQSSQDNLANFGYIHLDMKVEEKTFWLATGTIIKIWRFGVFFFLKKSNEFEQFFFP